MTDRAYEKIAQARTDAWAAYNENPNDKRLLDLALCAQRTYDAWWRAKTRQQPIPMNGTDYHVFGEE